MAICSPQIRAVNPNGKSLPSFRAEFCKSVPPTSNFYFPILQYFKNPKSESRHVAVILISHGIPPPTRRQSSQRPEIHRPQVPPGQGSLQPQCPQNRYP